jgi:hypothetical protein
MDVCVQVEQPDEQLSRTMTYSGQVRTLAWIGAQAVHEVEHHLADVRAQLG